MYFAHVPCRSLLSDPLHTMACKCKYWYIWTLAQLEGLWWSLIRLWPIMLKKLPIILFFYAPEFCLLFQHACITVPIILALCSWKMTRSMINANITQLYTSWIVLKRSVCMIMAYYSSYKMMALITTRQYCMSEASCKHSKLHVCCEDWVALRSGQYTSACTSPQPLR